MIFDETTQNVLVELEKTQKEFWNISRDTANFLSILIQASNSKEVLELGTSNGYSGIWLAKALKKTGGHLTTMEFWDKRLSVAIENFKTCGVNDIITPVLGSIKDNLPNIDKTFDFVFMDANKLEYLSYFEMFRDKLKKGGIIAADNILSHEKKVKPFVDAIMADEGYQTQILELPAGLLLSYKL